MSNKITALVSARKNSKYLGKFIEGYRLRTTPQADIELLVMLNEHDTWNNELVQNLHNFQEQLLAPLGVAAEDYPIRFYRENMRLGRAGLHAYFNELVTHATGDWLIYFCEDHFITKPYWDKLLLDYVAGRARSGDSGGKEFPLDPAEVWVLVPKFDNCGAMNHIVSRGFIEALGGIGNHGWIDSYINDLMRDFPNRVIRIDEEWFHDFTHDKPNPMSEAHLQGESSEKGKALPAFDSDVTRRRLADDKIKLERAIAKEGRS